MVTPSGKLETELPPVREPPRESDYRSVSSTLDADAIPGARLRTMCRSPMFKLVMFSIAMVRLNKLIRSWPSPRAKRGEIHTHRSSCR